MKPLDKFYKHPRTKDGRLNKCKECAKKDARENRLLRIDYYREYDRKRGSRIENAKHDSIKNSAHLKVSRAIKLGLLKRPESCESCEEIKPLHAHHDDYAKPLSVMFLCAACHKARHKEIGWGYIWNVGRDAAG